MNSNDPGREIPEDWFEESPERIKMVKDANDISQNFRYAPVKDKDELPTDLTGNVPLLVLQRRIARKVNPWGGFEH